jgi:hypothetical protein
MLLKKKIIHYGLLCGAWTVVFLFCLEATSWYIIIIKGANFYLPVELKLADTPKMKARFARVFSRDLGWEPQYPTSSLGYRGADKNNKPPYMAVFGDSFTQGYSDIEQSWPFLLEQKMNHPVLNFGVDGYGTDQAYLRFEKYYAGKIKTPFVAMCVMSENIARVVNRYRGFYARKIIIDGTKPMYYQEPDGRMILLPNPLQSADEIGRLRDPAFLKQIGQHDYWYNYFEQYDLNHFIRFPYAYYLIKAMPYYARSYYHRRVGMNPDYHDLYRNAEACAVMDHIIFKFINRARELGTFPVILFFPNWKDMAVYLKEGTTAYRDFYLGVKSRHGATFNAMDYFQPLLDNKEPIASFFKHMLDAHYNPYGEKIISEGLFRDMQRLAGERVETVGSFQ